MTTVALTLTDFDGKFKNIKSYVTNDTLALINKSETMKEQIRSYQADTQTKVVILDTAKPDAASYTAPVPAKGREPAQSGVASFGTNRINTPEGFIQVVSHELGHYAVESPGAAIANARASAISTGDRAAYEAACYLTEGYAALASAKVIDEIMANSATGSGGLLAYSHAHEEYRKLLPLVTETSPTVDEMNATLAFGLGEGHKIQTTSTTGETYLQFCRRNAAEVISRGTAATAPAEQEGATVLSNTLDADGKRTSSIATPDAQGELHPSYSNSEYAPGEGGGRETTITLDGQQTSSFYDSDGTLTGRSTTLDRADGTSTSDSLANMLQNLRDTTGDLDDMLLDAAELRALSGSQAQGEDWGGAHLLILGDSTLGDYYRHHQDIQTGNVVPLMLDDPQTQGLGTGNTLNNTLSGNAGNNTLAGGIGGDTYAAYRGMGQDRIVENDATPGTTDVLSFDAGVNANQLWFRKTGNDLEASIIGTADKFTVQDWYLGSQYHVERIMSGDGKLLQDNRVDQLVQAMAGFAPPVMGQTALTAAQQTALAPVLAANWQ